MVRSQLNCMYKEHTYFVKYLHMILFSKNSLYNNLSFLDTISFIEFRIFQSQLSMVISYLVRVHNQLYNNCQIAFVSTVKDYVLFLQ